jgi:hypothetical protein
MNILPLRTSRVVSSVRLNFNLSSSSTSSTSLVSQLLSPKKPTSLSSSPSSPFSSSSPTSLSSSTSSSSSLLVSHLLNSKKPSSLPTPLSSSSSSSCFLRSSSLSLLSTPSSLYSTSSQQTTTNPLHMTEFKEAIAEQMAILVELPKEEIVGMIECPRDMKKGDFAIPVPKFNKLKKFPGNPNEWAAKWAAEVSSSRSSFISSPLHLLTSSPPHLLTSSPLISVLLGPSLLQSPFLSSLPTSHLSHL